MSVCERKNAVASGLSNANMFFAWTENDNEHEERPDEGPEETASPETAQKRDR